MGKSKFANQAASSGQIPTIVFGSMCDQLAFWFSRIKMHPRGLLTSCYVCGNINIDYIGNTIQARADIGAGAGG